MTHQFRTQFAAALVIIAAGSSAMAQEAGSTTNDHVMGQHPAILVQRMQQPGIDTNRFIVAHPAGLMVIATPTPTFDHPAVIVARRAKENAADQQAAQLALYMSQPQVASAWLRHGETTVAARRATQGS
ncbi:hypothetical protein BH11PSE9_BH11PSE9_20950 [soil metagenome]